MYDMHPLASGLIVVAHPWTPGKIPACPACTLQARADRAVGMFPPPGVTIIGPFRVIPLRVNFPGM